MVIKIQIPDKDKTHLFAPEEVICFKADGKYTDSYIVDTTRPDGFRVLKASKNLKLFGDQVARLDFQRVNRSVIINLHKLSAIGHDGTLGLTIDLPFRIIANPAYRKLLHKLLDIKQLEEVAELVSLPE